MGGRGSFSMSLSSELKESQRGQKLARDLGIDAGKANRIYDAIQSWADDSTPIKNAQRNQGEFTESDAQNAALLDEFIELSPPYEGELVRCIGMKDVSGLKKGGNIPSDGSITSWTVPGNVDNAKTFVAESDALVVLHVSASVGADTRPYSSLSDLDHEIIQARGYDASLSIAKVQKKQEYRPYSTEKETVYHVYLTE